MNTTLFQEFQKELSIEECAELLDEMILLSMSSPLADDPQKRGEIIKFKMQISALLQGLYSNTV